MITVNQDDAVLSHEDFEYANISVPTPVSQDLPGAGPNPLAIQHIPPAAHQGTKKKHHNDVDDVTNYDVMSEEETRESSNSSTSEDEGVGIFPHTTTQGMKENHETREDRGAEELQRNEATSNQTDQDQDKEEDNATPKHLDQCQGKSDVDEIEETNENGHDNDDTELIEIEDRRNAERDRRYADLEQPNSDYY